MDDNRILTNKIFKQKINELVGADVIELEAANDDLALNCKVFETGMDAIKTIIPEPGPTPPTPVSGSKILVCYMSKAEGDWYYTCDKLYSEIINAYLFGDYDYIVAKVNVNQETYWLPFVKGYTATEAIIFSGTFKNYFGLDEIYTLQYSGNENKYSYNHGFLSGTEIARLTLYDAEHSKYRSDKTLAELYDKWQNGWSIYVEFEIDPDEPMRIPIVTMGHNFATAITVALNDGTPGQIKASWSNPGSGSYEEWTIEIE